MQGKHAALLLCCAASLALGSAQPANRARIAPSDELQVAIEFYSKAVAANPERHEGYQGLAVAYRRSERFEEARVALEAALTLNPAPIIHREVGLLLRMIGNYSGAAHHLSQSVQGGAISATALLLIGLERFVKGHSDEAVRVLQAALRLTDPALSGTHAVALTQALLASNRRREARNAYRMASRERLFVAAEGGPGSGRRRQWVLNPALGVVWPPLQPLPSDGTSESAGRLPEIYSQAHSLSTARCEETLEAVRRDSAAVRAQLQWLQHERPCSQSPQVVYVLSGDRGGVGLGCEIHGLALALSTAYRLERTLVLAPSAWWLAAGPKAREDGPGAGPGPAAEGACDGGGRADGGSGFGRVLLPVSRCKVGDSSDPIHFTPGADAFAPADRFSIPPAFAAHGHLWWRSQLIGFLFRPCHLGPLVPIAPANVAAPDSPAAAALPPRPPPTLSATQAGPQTLGRAETSSGTAEGWVDGGQLRIWCGIHVRRGDKASEVPLPQLEVYADALEALLFAQLDAHTHGPGEEWRPVVLVVSDSPDTAARLVELARARLEATAWLGGRGGSAAAERWVRPIFVAGPASASAERVLPQTRSGHLARDFPTVDVARITRAAAAELHYLASAEHLILTLSSNFGRAAYELQIGRLLGAGVCPAPPISLDMLWHDPH